jgi:hypothetical protein
VLSSDGNSVHLPRIKRTSSLMIGNEHDRVGYVVYCALVHKAPFAAGRGGDATGGGLNKSCMVFCAQLFVKICITIKTK